MTTKPLEMTAKGVETTGKPFGMTGKGVGNRSSRSVREENSEFGRVAPSGRPGEAESDSAEPRGVRLGVLKRKSQPA
jgi:hypothetical protein